MIRRIKKWAKPYEVAKAFVTMMLVILVPTAVYNQVHALETQRKINYYSETPTTAFYANYGIVMSDVCYGDTRQSLTTNRTATGTDTGWQIDVVKTLNRENQDGTNTEVYSTEVSAFVETSKNGFSTRDHAIPVRAVGSYHWELQITRLYLPYDVVRYDVPLIRSTAFEIHACEQTN